MSTPPPLPVGTPPPVELDTQTGSPVAETSTTEDSAEPKTKSTDELDKAAEAAVQSGVRKGKGDWAAVWSAEANAYYFWNETTQEVTWENPLVGAAEPSTSASLPPEPSTSSSADVYGGIDPDLAYLDPSLSRSTTSISATPAFQARFNARTGRFQGDPTMNPDRISEFKRGERQQGAYYDVDGWNESLAGRGIRGADEDERGGKKRKVTAKDVEKFKAKKLEKKKKALSWLKD